MFGPVFLIMSSFLSPLFLFRRVFNRVLVLSLVFVHVITGMSRVLSQSVTLAEMRLLVLVAIIRTNGKECWWFA